MGDHRRREAGPGASATAEWRRATISEHRRRLVASGLTAVALALLVVGMWRADGRLAVVGAAAALVAWWCRPDRDVDRWRRGAEGEVATAALLARLPRRWAVLHDRAVPGSSANIDHLVIGPTGVWVVDTKSTRAPLRVKRGGVWAGEHRIDTGAATWEAGVVAEWLGVRAVPIVAVHGSGLRRRGKSAGGVRVVPADRLVRRLRRGRRMLSRADVTALACRAAEHLPPR